MGLWGGFVATGYPWKHRGGLVRGVAVEAEPEIVIVASVTLLVFGSGFLMVV